MANGQFWRDDFAGTGAITTNMDGAAYTQVDAQWTRASGLAQCSGGVTPVLRWTGGLTGQGFVSITNVANPNDQSVNFGLEICSDFAAGNRIQVQQTNSGTYVLFTYLAGVPTQRATGVTSAAAGDRIHVECLAGVVTTYINGILQWTWAGGGFGAGGTGYQIFGGTSGHLVSFDNFACFSGTVHPTTWIVAPTGSALGDGSIASPLDWTTAMTDAGLILGGDTVLVRGGAHGTSGGTPVIAHGLIAGTAASPTTIKRFPGDGWPRIYLGLLLNTPGNGYLNFSGLQFVQNNPARTNNYRGDNPSYGDGGIVLAWPHCRFDYCIVANNAFQAWFWAEQAYDSTVHMCLTYYNGFRDLFNGLPATQGFYRQSDDAGTQLYQTMDTCLTCFNYQSGMQIYGSGASLLEYAKTFKSLFFMGGFLGASYAGGQAIHEILLGSTSDAVHADQCYFDKNWLWAQGGGNGAQLGFNGHDNTFVSWTNNVEKGQHTIQYFRALEEYGNTTIMPNFNAEIWRLNTSDLIGAIPTPTGLGVDHNAFYGSNDGDHSNHARFQWDDTHTIHNYDDMASLYAGLGYDQHSTLGNYGTQPTMSAVMPNTYEPTAVWPSPRAFVYVFNFQAQPSVVLDFSGVLAVGESYALYDWGTYELDSPSPIVSGVYTGTPITLRLAVQTAPVLIADQTSRAQHDIPPALDVAGGTMPGAYILGAIPPADTGTVVASASPLSGYVTFLAQALVIGGLRQGDRYYVCHYLDTTPEKFGRIALSDGVWQGGDIFCSVANAYPDSIGPFYVIKSGRSGTGLTVIHRSYLDSDAARRRNS